jgi:Bacterial SH3 domain
MTFGRTVASAGVLLALSAASAAAAPALAVNNVNLRQGPGIAYTIIMTIPGGSNVDVSGCSGQWCQVTFQGQNGYAIATSFDQGGGMRPPSVAVAPPAAPPPAGYAPPPGYAGPPPGIDPDVPIAVAPPPISPIGPPPVGPPVYVGPPPPAYYFYGYRYGPYYGPYGGGYYYRRW